MTFEHPQFPPVAGRMRADEPLGMAYGLVPRNQQRWTFGFRLVDQDPNNPQSAALRTKYGNHLCEVVARCLMNKQAHRPTLQQLQDWAVAALTAPWGGGPPPAGDTTTAGYAAWKAGIFGNPREPAIPWQLEHSGIRNTDIDPFWDYAQGEPI